MNNTKFRSCTTKGVHTTKEGRPRSMINIWRNIETLPRDNEPFMAAKSISNGRKNGGVLLRRSRIYTKHEYEQWVSGAWHPALFSRPKYWMRPEASDVRYWKFIEEKNDRS